MSDPPDNKSGNGKTTRPPMTASYLQHELWLRQFASLMEYQSNQNNVPATPFRKAVVTRLRWAADHISKLEAEIRLLEHQLMRDGRSGTMTDPSIMKDNP